MLTKSDIKLLRGIFATKEDLKKFSTKDDLKSFATKEDLKEYATKEDLVNFKDAILHEIVAMRQELAIVIGYRDQIEDHEIRLEKLEKKTLAN